MRVRAYIAILIMLMVLFINSGLCAQNYNSSYKATVRTNLLLDVAAVPNIGEEINIGNRWSVGASVYGWSN